MLLVPYRGDETDPLEIIIAQRRAMRRAILIGLVAMVLPIGWLNPVYVASRLVNAVLASEAQSQPIATPQPPRKMTAAEVEQQLRRTRASSGAPRDLVCSAGTSGWDYVCSYRSGETLTAGRLKIGVMVNPTAIVRASLPYPVEQPLPDAPNSPSGAPFR